MKFSELSYERIDIAALKSELQDITDRLRNAESFTEADAAFGAMNDCEGRSLLTQRTIAQIRRDINTKDEFYDGEMTYYNKALPELQPLRKAWTKPCWKAPGARGWKKNTVLSHS